MSSPLSIPIPTRRIGNPCYEYLHPSLRPSVACQSSSPRLSTLRLTFTLVLIFFLSLLLSFLFLLLVVFLCRLLPVLTVSTIALLRLLSRRWYSVIPNKIGHDSHPILDSPLRIVQMPLLLGVVVDDILYG